MLMTNKTENTVLKPCCSVISVKSFWGVIINYINDLVFEYNYFVYKMYRQIKISSA